MVRKETLLTTSMILLIAYTISLSLVGQGITQSQSLATIQSSGNIQATLGIGLYSNLQGTTPLTSLPWGTLEPGQSQTATIYVKNEGNQPTTLSLQTDNWNPISAGTYLILSWNYDNQPIDPNEIVQITLTLNVNQNIEGITNFSFDITIIGS